MRDGEPEAQWSGKINGQVKISVTIPESFCVHTDLCQRLYREVDSIATGLRIVYSPNAVGRIEIQYHNPSDCYFTETEDIITSEQFACYCRQIKVVRLLRELCGAQKTAADNETVLSVLEARLADECVQLWYSRVLPKDRKQASAYLIQYFDGKCLLTALAKQYWDTPDEVARKFGKPETAPMKKKKVQTIGIFNYQMWNGGTDRVISILAPMYEEMGCRLVVITMEGPTPEDFPLRPGIPHLQITGNWETHSGNLDARLDQWDKLINEYSIDLIIYHPWTFRLLVWDVLFLKLRGVSVVFHIHSVFSFLLAEGKIEFSLLPNRLLLGDGIVVISKTDQIFWGCFHENVHHIPNPVAPELMQAKQSSGEGNKLVWIGRFTPEKRPMDAIQIMEHVARQHPDAVLYMIGGGDEDLRRQCQSAVQEMGLEHNVEFLGFRKNVYQYLETASVHVITSFYEGFSLSLLEAMAHGVPTVMYEMPYLDLYRARAKYGVLGIEEANCKQAAAEICRLLEDHSAWEQVSQVESKAFAEMARYDYQGAWQKLFSGEESPCVSTEEEKVMMRAVVDHYLDGWKLNHTAQIVNKGSVFTRLKSKIAGGIRCVRMHGVWYTLRRIMEKFLRSPV